MKNFDRATLEGISDICRKYRVKHMDLFGSATREDFDPARSDIDVVFEFDSVPEDRYFDTYFDLKESLEAHLGLPVDLLVEQTIRNPILLEAINESRRPLYAV